MKYFSWVSETVIVVNVISLRFFPALWHNYLCMFKKKRRKYFTVLSFKSEQLTFHSGTDIMCFILL